MRIMKLYFIRLVLIFTFVFYLGAIGFVFNNAMAQEEQQSEQQSADSVNSTSNNGEQTDEEKRKALEAELDQLEALEKELEAEKINLNKKGNTLSSEVKRLDSQITKLKLQIKAVNLTIERIDDEIKITQGKIKTTEGDIDFHKEAIADILQAMYESEKKGILEILLANNKLSEFFTNVNNLMSAQEKLGTMLQKFVDLRQRLVDEKEDLALEKIDAAALKAEQDAQKAKVQKTQTDKNKLLKDTKNKESEYQKKITETKKSAAEIRKQIFKFIGGGELDFEAAYELAKVAEKATDVRAALILAVLDRESKLGKNVGQCDYKKAMHPTRDIPVFLAMVEELGLMKNLESGFLKVSCAIVADGAYGGAVGPAQFIPSTWAMYTGYAKKNGEWTRNPDKDRISQITGSNPPNPWRNADAFVATALYLKDAGAQKGSISSERTAAAKYYAGSRWKNYLWTYGDRVVSKAEKFQDDIDVLSG